MVPVLDEMQQICSASIRFNLVRKRRRVDRVHGISLEHKAGHCVALGEEDKWVYKFTVVLPLRAKIKQMPRDFNAIKIRFAKTVILTRLFDPRPYRATNVANTSRLDISLCLAEFDLRDIVHLANVRIIVTSRRNVAIVADHFVFE